MRKSLTALVSAAVIGLGSIERSLYAQTPIPQAPISNGSLAVRWEPWPRPTPNVSQTPTPQTAIPPTP